MIGIMKITPRDERTARFIEFIQYLKDSGLANSARHAMESLGSNPYSLTSMKKGRSSATAEMIEQAFRVYNANIHWFFTGEGDMFKNYKKVNSENDDPETWNAESLRIRVFKVMNKLMVKDECSSLYDYCKRHDLVYTSIKQYEKHVTQKPPSKLMDHLYDRGVRLEFLFTGYGSMFRDDDKIGERELLKSRINDLETLTGALKDQVRYWKDQAGDE